MQGAGAETPRDTCPVQEMGTERTNTIKGYHAGIDFWSSADVNSWMKALRRDLMNGVIGGLENNRGHGLDSPTHHLPSESL